MKKLTMRAADFQRRFVRLLEPASGLGPLLLRLYLAPILLQAGWTKLTGFEATTAWLGNPDWGLGLPFPGVLAFLAVTRQLCLADRARFDHDPQQRRRVRHHVSGDALVTALHRRRSVHPPRLLDHTGRPAAVSQGTSIPRWTQLRPSPLVE